ncbi:D-alanyl-D-alanine carboxypeptidase/D-alanyl-D-alanine endopeptidase [Leptodesmis sp.]|uniref:D-alanyl-D-alanine carboxypeptidase/D-alanyl-D-alanine endopeptidase n=1 Tax=Leptodesmis sp. TaxID=3100501 RepID=UPI0040534B8B
MSSVISLVSLLLRPSVALAQPSQEVRSDQNTVGQILTPVPLCPIRLPASINEVLNRLPTTRWGILVQTLDTPTSRFTLYAQNPDRLLIPASNNKLLTTTAALQQLGANYRIRTTVTGNDRSSSLSTLRIIGRGDPSLTTAHLTRLTQQLAERNIRQVALLIGDDTYFQGTSTNPNWDPDDTLQGYGAPVNSLMLNQNGIGVTLFPQRAGQPLRVQWDDPTDAQTHRLVNQSVTVAKGQDEFVEVYRDRTDGFLIRVEGQLQEGSAAEPVAASIANPGNYLVDKFRRVLLAHQIDVARSTVVKITPTPPGEVELAALESPSLADMLKETNQNSNNVYAEALLKTLGRLQNPHTQDATASGITAVKAILAPLGVNPNHYRMVDGSGLANQNRATASVLVQTLQAIAQAPNAQIFRASLPVAGVSGTLRDRFRGTAAQGRLQAKTGTITGVVALSGYLTPPKYPPLAFSILANDPKISASRLRAAVDEIVLLLTRLQSC